MNSELTIFIIDDSPSDVALLKKYLSRHLPNAIFITAEGFESFKQKHEWAEADLYVCDYNMPDGNGLDLLLYIKERNPHTPFLFVTGMLNDEQKTAETILKGAQGYLLKQNISQVGEFVTNILDNHKQTKSIQEIKTNALNELKIQMDKISAFLDNKASNSEIKAEIEIAKALVQKLSNK